MTVTVGDGVETATATSAAVAVVNSLPQAPGLELRPDPPEHGAPLTCVVAAGAVDADGDAVTYEMSWAVDGAAWTASGDSGAADSGAAGTDSIWPGDTVPADVVRDRADLHASRRRRVAGDARRGQRLRSAPASAPMRRRPA